HNFEWAPTEAETHISCTGSVDEAPSFCLPGGHPYSRIFFSVNKQCAALSAIVPLHPSSHETFFFELKFFIQFHVVDHKYPVAIHHRIGVVFHHQRSVHSPFHLAG